MSHSSGGLKEERRKQTQTSTAERYFLFRVCCPFLLMLTSELLIPALRQSGCPDAKESVLIASGVYDRKHFTVRENELKMGIRYLLLNAFGFPEIRPPICGAPSVSNDPTHVYGRLNSEHLLCGLTHHGTRKGVGIAEHFFLNSFNSREHTITRFSGLLRRKMVRVFRIHGKDKSWGKKEGV